MTLRDKIDCTLERHIKLKENQSENLEKIVEEFAMNFAQWTRDMGYCHHHSYAHSYRELIEMYKKEQNL